MARSDDHHNDPGNDASDPRRDYADSHDPLAGIGGAPAAYSALTLRLVLACIGVVIRRKRRGEPGEPSLS